MYNFGVYLVTLTLQQQQNAYISVRFFSLCVIVRYRMVSGYCKIRSRPWSMTSAQKCYEQSAKQRCLYLNLRATLNRATKFNQTKTLVTIENVLNLIGKFINKCSVQIFSNFVSHYALSTGRLARLNLRVYYQKCVCIAYCSLLFVLLNIPFGTNKNCPIFSRVSLLGLYTGCI